MNCESINNDVAAIDDILLVLVLADVQLFVVHFSNQIYNTFQENKCLS